MIFNWNLPVEWCHSGVPLGNGLFGTLIWGERKTLKVTFNRSDYWFYGENLPPDRNQSYANLKKYLSEDNEAEVKRIFGGIRDGQHPASSSRLPMGRLDIGLPGQDDGTLFLDTGSALGTYAATTCDLKIRAVVPRGIPLLALSVTGKDYRCCTFNSVPSDAEDIRNFYDRNGFPGVRKNDATDNRSGGWVQEVPGSRSLGVCWLVKKSGGSPMEVFLAAALENTPEQASLAAVAMAEEAMRKGFALIAAETAAWWQEYWKKTPSITLPDAEINDLYRLGMYRLAGLCSPDAPPSTLQGAWAEDYRMPPWSCDYHFNINVQECYWPVFPGNIPEFIQPLFKMIKSWEPLLREYAENFVGIKDGLMLPHATDDRGSGMGGFWPGHIDHSCTAWVAQLMWLYWKYTLDDKFMKGTLYPFMRATMNVYDAMLEEDADGNFFLAAESSPEYHENRIDAWGRNPSIHLAAIHFLIASLLEITEKAGIADGTTERWKTIAAKLPSASISAAGTISIWDGQPLAEPHRHFSHLASLHPFDLLDWRHSEKDAELLSKTICQWITEGTGLWSGWSFPWASIIYSRMEMPEAAHTMLSIFRRAFMKDDYALRYLPDRACFTAVAGPTASLIMQIEAGMASAAAVMEMCVHSSHGVIYPFAGIPDYWQEVSWAGIRTEGAFLVSGRKADGCVSEIAVESEKGGILKINIPKGRYRLSRHGEIDFFFGGKIYETHTVPNGKIIFSRM